MGHVVSQNNLATRILVLNTVASLNMWADFDDLYAHFPTVSSVG